MTRARTMKSIAALSFALLMVAASAEPGTEAGFTTPYYQIQGGRIDAATFAGWRMYHQTCVQCHGADAIATGPAPDLLESVRRLSPDAFRIRVLNRYLISVPAAEQGTDIECAQIALYDRDAPRDSIR